MLQPLTGESFQSKTANTCDEARSDVSVRDFWCAGQVAFLDIRVFNPNATRYANQKISKTYESNEKEKKRCYNERVLQVEHGSFTPLVLSATGGMGRECRKFYTRLAEMIAEKRKQPYSLIAAWLKRKICFSLMRSISLCIRGSRTKNPSYQTHALLTSISEDAATSEAVSRINI
jgi:hypothetical protein